MQPFSEDTDALIFDLILFHLWCYGCCTTVFTAHKRSLGQGNIFAPICYFVHRVGWGVPGPGGRGAWSKGAWSGGWCLVPGGCLVETPPTATAAGGTHPTGMHSYLVCLQIIEAMPHTEMVSDFIEKLGDFYVLVDDDETPVPNGDLNPDGSPKRVGQMLRQHRLAQKSSPTRSGNQLILFLLSES